MFKRNEVSMFRWYVYFYVYSNFIYSNYFKCLLVVEWMNKMCFLCVVEWINKMCFLYEGIFFSYKNIDFFICNSMDEYLVIMLNENFMNRRIFIIFFYL